VTSFDTPLSPAGDGKAETRFEARSQDIGSMVLVVAAGRLFGRAADFSVKEKDEARALTIFNVAECLHSRLPRRVKAFPFPSRTGLPTTMPAVEDSR
jgi:hypothetical protein